MIRIQGEDQEGAGLALVDEWNRPGKIYPWAIFGWTAVHPRSGGQKIPAGVGL